MKKLILLLLFFISFNSYSQKYYDENDFDKSKDFDNVYFVALDIPNRGVGVWALGGSGGSCFAVNDVAQEVSVYPQGQMSMFDDGALSVRKCVQNKKK